MVVLDNHLCGGGGDAMVNRGALRRIGADLFALTNGILDSDSCRM